MQEIAEYKLEASDRTEPKDESTPIYYEQLDIPEEDKTRIVQDIMDEFEAIKGERDGEKLEEKWDTLDRQYSGLVKEDTRRMFNLCRKITKVKVNRVVNMIMQAFMKSDPKYSVTPRPEFMRQGGQEVADNQSDFLDYKLDNLPFRDPEGLTVHSAVLKGTGILKVYHLIKKEKKKREEQYKGTPKLVMGQGGQQAVDPQTGMPIVKNDGLEEFLRNWPEAPKDYPGLIKKLEEGKEIKIVAEYTEMTYNDPAFKNIDLKNFFVRLNTDGYEGLKSTKLVVERQEYNYWDLKLEEKKGFFKDIDEITYEDEDKKKRRANYQTEVYQILECTYFGKLKEDDEEEIKIVCWIAEEKKVMIGAITYPYYAIDCSYIPHYITKKCAGFYQPGLGEDMTDTNIAENAILNHILESAWMQNLITPIVPEGSDIQKQFLEKTWTHGIPLIKGPGEEVDFLQKYMPKSDVGGMISLIQYLIQGDDDVTGVSSLMSGRESPVDPTAPASKTMALLAQSGINIEDYILTISPSFNLIGELILQIYYQMSTDGVKYQPKPERVTGSNPFKLLSRADMMARTNLQVQAYAFDFNKLDEVKKDMALYQLFRQDPIVARYPEAIYVMAKNLIKGWSPKWANLVDTIMPSPQEFKKEQLQTAAQAIALYVQGMAREAKLTGQPPVIDPKQLLAVMQQAMVESVTPPPKEVVDQREKDAAKPV